MSNIELDFKGLAENLIGRSRELMVEWLPGGGMQGREYTCSGLRGGSGRSLSVNTETGAWADFAGDVKGGDLISLWAAIQGIKQGEAARELSSRYGYGMLKQAYSAKDAKVGKPPVNAARPNMRHYQHGEPSLSWCYNNAEGEHLFYIARYDAPEGKQIIPWSWDETSGRWCMKGQPTPRPLYGLDLLSQRPNDPVLVVEGEKAADAAREMIGSNYVVVTWPNGSKAVDKADWSTIKGRTVLVWPDADDAGIAAGYLVAAKLKASNKAIKMLSVTDMPAGYDAADALNDGMDRAGLIAWAKPRARVYPEDKKMVVAGMPSHRPAIEPEIVDDPEAAEIVSRVEVTVSVKDDEAAVTGSMFGMWEKLDIALTAGGSPICNVDNALRVIENFEPFKDLLWYDEFHHKYFTRWKSERAREWLDIDNLNLLAFMQRQLGLTKIGDEMIHKASVVYAHKRVRNEPRDWMESLKWDGVDRIEHFFVDCMGADDSEYARAVGKNFFIGMAARVFMPGCQLDNMVILEGSQGAGKTSALRAIGGSWYTEAKESVQSNDFFMVLHGKILVEIAELDSFSKAEVTRIKQVITSCTDRYRAPYARTAQDHPRMSLFVGTTNEDTYLRDASGARRFWPIRCGVINLDAIRQMRQQLFAEAVARYKQGESWYKMPEATAQVQESRRQVDEWEPLIETWLDNKPYITINDIAFGCLKIETSKLDIQTQRRIGNILRVLKWDKRTERRGRSTVKAWFPPSSPVEDSEDLPFDE